MNKIDGKAKNIRELLGGSKFAIDYYQRGYSWKTKQVIEFIEDLTEKFLDNHGPDKERKDVKHYEHYFLGSIVISEKGDQRFIIDGQQRLTTTTLLIIYLYHHLKDGTQKQQLSNLISSQSYGDISFNLNIEERDSCMNALLDGTPFDDTNSPDSVVNINARYQDIVANFPTDLTDDSLPYFADWLTENVDFVEITTYSDEYAYMIFETMNDRGLSLASIDMLKGYLLANITDNDRRNKSNDVWRERIAALRKLGKEEDSDAVKAWLRSQHAKTIRERTRGAQPQDFDLIGTGFHRWIRDRHEHLGLKRSALFENFIQDDFTFYTRWYERIRHAAQSFEQNLACIYYNAQSQFTLQYPVLLAPLCKVDLEEDCLRKLRITAAYLEIMIARRIWNRKATNYSTMQYAMFLLILDIRGKSTADLVEILIDRLTKDEHTFSGNHNFHLHGGNGPQVHRLLARMTDFVEVQSGQSSRYTDYIKRSGNGYEIEHIWANHHEHHTDEFPHPYEFLEYRNRIGGLLLLPKSINASYGDLPYSEKRTHYNGQNLLARSLCDEAYQRNPRFTQFCEETGLNFQSHAEFKKADLDARQDLYCQIAEQIWSPDRLRQEAGR